MLAFHTCIIMEKVLYNRNIVTYACIIHSFNQIRCKFFFHCTISLSVSFFSLFTSTQFFTVNVTVPLSTGLVGDEDDSVISFTIVPGNDVDPVLNNNNVDITVDITAVNEVSIQPV